MVAKIKQLKTQKCVEKDRMIEFLEAITKRIRDDEISSLVCLIDNGESVETEVLGELNFLETIGIMETAKTALELSMLEPV